MRVAVPLPQSLADEHTLIAQNYAGHFVGHPYRAGQQRTGPGAIQVDRSKRWREPAVIADACDFCARLSDDDAVRRIAGYQHAIDIEVLRARAASFADWLSVAGADVPEVEEAEIAGETVRRGVANSAANRRAFLETHAEEFDVNALSMIGLPLRLKRKLCIEWNHLYRDWLGEHPDTWYDFDEHEFYREIDEQPAPAPEQVKQWWAYSGFGGPS
jgi:hypothetical protein